MIRRYRVPITADRLTQAGTYDFALDQLVNGNTMKAKRFHLNDGCSAESGYIYLENRRDRDVSFGTHEALVLHEAVKRDIAAGTCGNYNWFDSGRAGQYAIDLNLDFRIDEKAENGTTRTYYDNINVALYPAMTHTVAALEELGLAAKQELKTYAELYPEEYGIAEKYGLDAPAQTDTIYDFGETASIGVIGGADGPTAVFVTGG